MFIIKIPVKSYLLKYLNKKHGSVLNVSKETALGIHLLELLEKDYDPSKVIKVETDAFYKLNISEFYSKTKGFEIYPDRLHDISIFLDKIFREHLFEFMDIHRQNFGMALPGMRIFLEYFNITENELKYDSIYRDYKRFKIKKKGTT